MHNYKTIKIFYFSGTGNAKRIASWLLKLAEAKNIECQMINIAKMDFRMFKNIESDSLIIIISPIHGFNYPNLVLKFLMNFPKGNNRIVLMNTRAGMKLGKFVTPGLTGIAFMLSSLILKFKGYQIQGQIPFDMPSNWISIHPALKESSVKYIHKVNFERVEKHAQKIYSGQKDNLAYRDIIQDLLLIPISFAFYLVGRFVFAKSFFASQTCDNCGKCQNNCPVHAIITVHEKPFWTFKCESCMNCMNNCPKNAIQTAHGLILFTSITSTIFFSFLTFNTFEIVIESSIMKLFLVTGIFLILFTVMYYLHHLLLKNRYVSKILPYASLTFYKFWGRYKSISDKKWKES